MASMLLFVFAAQAFGLEEEDTPAANDSINASLTNETIQNATLTNETIGNETISNATLENTTLAQDDSNPFADAKNRKPSSR